MNLLKPVITIAAALACMSSQPSWGADNNEWSFWIEQDGQKFYPTKTLVLAKKPFTFNFKGLPESDYGLAATSVLEELPTPDNLDAAFRVSNGLLVDDPNTKISISGPGLINKGWSSWNMWAYHSPLEAGLISSFQSRTMNADGTVTLSRGINMMCLDDGQRDVCKPTSAPVFAAFHMLVTRIPHLKQGQSIKETRWLDPRLVSVQFR